MSEPFSVKPLDLKKLKPYGDIMGDGVTMVSLTLPVDPSAEAYEAATQMCRKMGLSEIKIATMEQAGSGFTFFIVYGKLEHTIDFTKIKAIKIDAQKRSREEIDALLKTQMGMSGRKVIILGACTGYDAHTVGIDAIMNMKGFAGDYGLERYEAFDARNLGAQILNEDLLKRAVDVGADVILVSKVVSQHNIHITDLKDLIAKAETMGVRDKFIFVAGGPRVTHQLALECGFDAGFGVGTKPADVASYIADEFLKRQGTK